MNKCSAISLFFSPWVIFLRISLSFLVRPKALFCFVGGGEDSDANPNSDEGANWDVDGDTDADAGSDTDIGMGVDGDEKAGLVVDVNGDSGIDS
jgi:hypothetical protein